MDVSSLASTNANQDVQTVQRHHGHRHDPQKFLEDLTQKLGLSDDQVSKIKTILEQNAPDTPGSVNSTPQPPDTSKLDEVNSKIESVLTDSQKAQFESFIQKLQQNRPAPPTGFQVDATQQSQQAATAATTSTDAILNAINTTGAVANSTTDNAIDFYA